MELQAGGMQSSQADVHVDLCDRLPEGVSVELDGSRPNASYRHVTSASDVRLHSSCVCPSHNIQRCRQHAGAMMRWGEIRVQAPTPDLLQITRGHLELLQNNCESETALCYMSKSEFQFSKLTRRLQNLATQ